MNKFKELFVTLADFVQGLNRTTVSIVVSVVFAVAFWCLLKFFKKNKSEATKINALGTLCTFILLLGFAVLIIKCLQY